MCLLTFLASEHDHSEGYKSFSLHKSGICYLFSLSWARKLANIIILKVTNVSSFLNGGFSWKEG